MRIFEPEIKECPVCGRFLCKKYIGAPRTIMTLNGSIEAQEHVKQCKKKTCSNYVYLFDLLSFHLRPVLAELYDEFDSMQRIHLIWDGGSSHISRDTQLFQKSYSNVRVLLTPAHASWLNQAELLLRAFTCRYLDRGDWKSRQDLIDHLDASWREYNHMDESSC